MTQVASPPSDSASPLTIAPDPPSSDLQDPPPKKSPLKILIPIVLLTAAIGIGVRYVFFPTRSDVLELSGRVEGYETDLGAKVGGRIATIAVREGDTVHQGDVVATLEDTELQAQLQTAKANVAAAQQQVNQAYLQIQVVDSQIEQNQLSLRQSEGDASGRIGQAQALVSVAQAQLAQSQSQVKDAIASLALAQVNRDRYAELLKQGAIAQQQLDQAETTFRNAQETLKSRQAAVGAAQQQIAAAQGSFLQSQTNILNPSIRAAQLKQLNIQKQQAMTQLAAAVANYKQAQAKQQETQAKINDLAIKSPIEGVVVTRTAEPGEVIAVGKTVLTVVNLNQVYLRGYIPEGDVGHIKVGQAAQVFLDSAPERPLNAIVAAVDTEASFTPENIYFKADRVTQVFGLKLNIENPQGLAKPGMPADAKLLRDDGAKP